jgi:hypothetical protein
VVLSLIRLSPDECGTELDKECDNYHTTIQVRSKWSDTCKNISTPYWRRCGEKTVTVMAQAAMDRYESLFVQGFTKTRSLLIV